MREVEMRKVFAELGTSTIVNLPSISVTVPKEVPFTNTDAPTTGSPSSSEITTPETVDVWAVTKPMLTGKYIYFFKRIKEKERNSNIGTKDLTIWRFEAVWSVLGWHNVIDVSD